MVRHDTLKTYVSTLPREYFCAVEDWRQAGRQNVLRRGDGFRLEERRRLGRLYRPRRLDRGGEAPRHGDEPAERNHWFDHKFQTYNRACK